MSSPKFPRIASFKAYSLLMLLATGLLVLALALLVALLTYYAGDPAWQTSGITGTDGIHNKLGHVGAWIADLLLAFLGQGSYFLPIGLGLLALQLFLSKQLDKEALSWRLTMLVIWVIAAALLFTAHRSPSPTPMTQTGGGIIGELLYLGLIKFVSPTFAVLISFAIALMALTVMLNIAWLKVIDATGLVIYRIGQKLLGRQMTSVEQPATNDSFQEKIKALNTLAEKKQVLKEQQIAHLAANQNLDANGYLNRYEESQYQQANSPIFDLQAERDSPKGLDSYTDFADNEMDFDRPISLKKFRITKPYQTPVTQTPQIFPANPASTPAIGEIPQNLNVAIQDAETHEAIHDIVFDSNAQRQEAQQKNRKEPRFFDFLLNKKPARTNDVMLNNVPTKLDAPVTQIDFRAVMTSQIAETATDPSAAIGTTRTAPPEVSTQIVSYTEMPMVTAATVATAEIIDSHAPIAEIATPLAEAIPISPVVPLGVFVEQSVQAAAVNPLPREIAEQEMTIEELLAANQAMRERLGQFDAAQSAQESVQLQIHSEKKALDALYVETQIERPPAAISEPIPVMPTMTATPITPAIAEADSSRHYSITPEYHPAESIPAPVIDVKPSGTVYQLPSIRLLDEPPVQLFSYTEDMLAEMAGILESTLKQFNVNAVVMNVSPGPVITRFELELAPGLQAKKITALSTDLARALAVSTVRVEEIIPGSSYVGLEVPNTQRQTVYFKDVICSETFRESTSPLTICLGSDISGKPVVADLIKMPHLLVAGTTGSGKSVCINVMLLSMLYKSTPADLRLILVDPKMLEMSMYEDIPHLLTPVITDMTDAENALTWAVAEMERRYRLMATLKVRKIDSLNELIEAQQHSGQPLMDPLWQPDEQVGYTAPPVLEKLPFIVIVIDELADMMMVVGKQVEQLIARLTQKARAAGIHVVLATQRPSVDVLTGLIKANVPTRIAFQVSSKIDSRTIIDSMGAETLLGNGDMLYVPRGVSHPTRLHGAFLDDQETDRVTNFLRETGGGPNYVTGITAKQSPEDLGAFGAQEASANRSDEELDPLYEEAIDIVISSGKASISSIQRQLRIGYNRSARMIEQMQTDGMVSEPVNGVRKVLGRR